VVAMLLRHRHTDEEGADCVQPHRRRNRQIHRGRLAGISELDWPHPSGGWKSKRILHRVLYRPVSNRFRRYDVGRQSRSSSTRSVGSDLKGIGTAKEMTITYKHEAVDIDSSNGAKKRIPALARDAFPRAVRSDTGSFAGRIACRFAGMKDRGLCSS